MGPKFMCLQCSVWLIAKKFDSVISQFDLLEKMVSIHFRLYVGLGLVLLMCLIILCLPIKSTNSRPLINSYKEIDAVTVLRVKKK